MEDSAIKATPVNHLVYSVNPSFFAFGRGVGMYETWLFISSLTHFFIRRRVFRAHLARIPVLTFETKKRLQHHFIVRRMGKKKGQPLQIKLTALPHLQYLCMCGVSTVLAWPQIISRPFYICTKYNKRSLQR